MADLYMAEDGDLVVSPSGDLAFTQTPWRDDVQQAYIRMMTDVGDWVTYPDLGASLSRLFGMPQSPDTGQLGVNLVSSALDREGRFVGKRYTVNAVPTGPQAIRFDVSVVSGNQQQITLSVEQGLGII
jgi:hypothetical protein